MTEIESITPTELKQRLDSGEDLLLLDVREEDEVALCALPGSLHLPMNRIPLQHNELPDDRTIVLYCHHGVRSLHSALYLADAGFERLINLKGGIDAWAREVDGSMPRY